MGLLQELGDKDQLAFKLQGETRARITTYEASHAANKSKVRGVRVGAVADCSARPLCACACACADADGARAQAIDMLLQNVCDVKSTLHRNFRVK